MKRLALLLAAACLLSAASAQWLDRTFWLGDSFPDLSTNRRLFVNPVSGRLYLGGDHNVQVYDCATGRKHAAWRDFEADGFTHYPQAGLVYCWWYSHVRLFDDRADTVLSRRINANGDMAAAAIDRTNGKLYAAVDREVEVFDARTGEFLRSTWLPRECYGLAWDSVSGRLFCTVNDGIAAVDCATDSVVCFVEVPFDTAVVSPGRREVVTAGGNVIRFLSADSLTVLDSIRLPFELYDERVFVDRRSDRLFAANIGSAGRGGGPVLPHNRIAVVDLRTNTLIAVVQLHDSLELYDAAVSDGDGRLYFREFYTDSLFVVAADGSVSGVALLNQEDWQGYGMAWHPTQNRIYEATTDTLFGVDCATGAVVDRCPYINYEADWLSWQPGVERLYFGGYRGIGWVGRRDTVGRWIPLDNYGLLAADHGTGRLYLSDYDRLLPYDCAADSLLEPVPCAPVASGRVSLLVPELQRLCIARPGRDTLEVYDTGADSLLVLTALGANVAKLGYHGSRRKVYVAASVQSAPPKLIELDPTSGTVTRRADVWTRLDGLAVNETQDEVWILDASGSISVYRCDSLGLTHTVALPGARAKLVLDEARGRAYCLGQGSPVTVVDCPSHAVVAQIDPGLGNPSYFAYLDTVHAKLYLGSDEGQVVIDCRGDSVMARVPARGKVLTANEAASELYSLFWAPDEVSVIRDNPPGVTETMNCERGMMNAGPTVIRGFLNLTPDITNLTSDIILLDVSGRRVLSLKPGRNDVSSLAPGVYFICPGSSVMRGASSVTKVVLTR